MPVRPSDVQGFKKISNGFCVVKMSKCQENKISLIGKPRIDRSAWRAPMKTEAEVDLRVGRFESQTKRRRVPNG